VKHHQDEPLDVTPDMLAPGGAGTLGRFGRIDFERGMRHTPVLILLLIAANVYLFVREVATGALTSKEHLIAAGALTRDGVLHGEWWRLLSAMFLHGGWDHLIGNCLVLYIVGMACEHAFGVLDTAIIYLVSGLTGSVTSVLFNQGPSVGASGAIFGVLGAVAVTLHRHQDRFYVRDKRIGIVLVAWAVYQIVTGLATPYIDNSAHLGGLAGGAAMAMLLTPRLLGEQASS
jgi:rhomboid protease GluP